MFVFFVFFLLFFVYFLLFFFFFFFFFQAEDGIRDLYVTGVQTCALPISAARWPRVCAVAPDQIVEAIELPDQFALGVQWHPELLAGNEHLALYKRSEERRVGKECRSRWWPDH